MAARRPVIGVTACRALDDYLASLRQSGAESRVLPPDSPAAVAADVDAVLLTGGADVDPSLFGQARHPSVQDAEPGRDRFELDLVTRAVANHLPVLAICRGIQVLNVAFGGTLIQDISPTGDTRHQVRDPKVAIAHTVRIAAGSRLAGILAARLGGSSTCQVNSRHHQAVDRLASGFVAVATAPDAIVEAIERPGQDFCVGVQWHPENFWRTGEFQALFDAFVTSCGAARA